MADLAASGRAFADRLKETIEAVLPGTVSIGAIIAQDQNSMVITAVNGSQSVDMPLTLSGERVATWRLSYQTSMDHTGQFLKTIKSAMVLTSVFEKTPLARLEYDSKMRTAPIAHWQFHGERGAFSHLLARAHSARKYVTDKPHALSSLHFPVGGERFRPGVEDFLEFLVRECGVDREDGWESAIQDGREIWRRFQMRTATRELQVEAAQILTAMNWTVSPPLDYQDDERPTALRQW